MPVNILYNSGRINLRLICRIGFCFSLLIFINKTSTAQISPDYDEVSVFLNFKLLGSTELPAVIKNENLYLSITELFDFLKISYTASPDMDSLYGFLQNQKDIFLIEKNSLRVSYQNKKYDLAPEDLISLHDQWFLISDRLNEIFGLQCIYNKRALTVNVTSIEELPVIRMMSLENKRLKYHRSSAIFVADTILQNKFKLIHFGSADWSITADQHLRKISNTRFGLSVGGILAGGEFNTILTHTVNRPFLERQQHYQWKYVRNNNSLVKQIIAGKISPQSISSIFDPVIGVQVTNAPTYSRKSFGFYTISDATEPNSIIEIYINNHLIDYIKSDASGFFIVHIPLDYGSTDVTLHFHGPNGDKEMTVKKFMIPLSFLPENEFEYRLTAGVLQDSEGSLYSQGKLNYGLTDNITIGGGMEYLSTSQYTQSLPFLNASVKLSSNLALSGEYVSGVRYKGILTYHSSSRLQFELNYTRYEEEQESVQYNYQESRKAVISMPFRLLRGAGVSKLSFAQNFNQSGIYNSMDLQFSYSTKGFNININNYAYLNKAEAYNIYSTVTSSIPLPGHFKLTPRVVYNYMKKDLISLTLGLEKTFTTNFSASISYEARFDNNERYFRAAFRRIFSFARLSTNINYSKNNTSFFQSASGSIIHENKANYLKFTKHSTMGKGGVAFMSFLDLNANGIRDVGELSVKGLNVTIFKGGGIRTTTDTSVIITGLEPTIYYGFNLTSINFENLSWRLSHDALNIMIAANQIKVVEVPVVPVGEVSGFINQQNENGLNGLGRIKINIINSKSIVVATVISESDGYFSYLGLAPGNYTAVLDSIQLDKIKMAASPQSIAFTIKQNIDGDIVDDLEFVVELRAE